MHCTLLVPDLLRRSDPDGTSSHEIHLPALARLLARARRTTFDAIGVDAWLCKAFGVECQHDWPIAPLTLAADGGAPGNDYWLRCDPIHLRAQRGQLLLMDISPFAPTQMETQALLTTLNAHFAQDNFVFLAPHPARWYLRIAHPTDLTTHMLLDVIGKNIDPYLPAGVDGLRLHRMLNEVQMLLHEHPVNQARESANRPAINSVWLWGGGVMPGIPVRPFTKVWSGGVLARALATAGNVAACQLPDNASQLIAAKGDDSLQQLAVLPAMHAASQFPTPGLWNATLNTLEQYWFAPLYSALRQRQLSGLALVVPGEKYCRRFDVTGADLWKFWKPIRALEHYA